MERMLQLTSRMYRFSLLMLLSLTVYCINAQANEKQGEGDIKINLTATAIPLKDVFKAIQKQSGLFVMYSNSQAQINREEKVSVSFKQARLDDVLNALFGPRHLGWRYSDKTIVLYAKADEVVETKKNGSDSSITTLSVSGKVTDAKGAPIPGATVQVKGSGIGAITDAQGLFSIPKVKSSDVLVVSSLGYQPREINPQGKSILVQLGVDVNDLGETVIVGYGTTTKRFNTGNVTTVKGEDIARQPVSNPLAALQGRVPGMVITQTTGVPGGRIDVLIRGRSSINGAVNNDPLYIVDGVPYPSQMLSNINNIGRGGSPLNFINPSDIESLSVLKDADATAIYGSRGANGVVLITTKKGKNERTGIDFNINSGFAQIGRKMRWLGREQYLEMRREAFKNDGAVPDQNNAPDLLLWDTTRYTDWQKELIGGTAHYTNAQLSISGGNKDIQYLVGGNYHRETTVFPGDGADRKSSVYFNLNNASPDGRFKLNFSGSYTSDRNSLVYSDLSSQVPFLAPIAPKIYNADGSLNWEKSTWSNPLATLECKYNGETNNLISNATLSYILLKGLNVKVNLGYSNMQVDEVTPVPTKLFDPAYGITTGRSTFNNSAVKSYIIEPQTTYEVTVGKGLLQGLLGTTYQKTLNNGRIIRGTGFSSDALLKNMQAATTLSVTNIVNEQYKYAAVFGRLNYNLMEKYVVNATIRRDGSSRFGPGKQFATFGALGAAWIFSSENLIKRVFPVMSFGKLRASYGTTGNDQIPNYGYLDLFSTIPQALPYQSMQGLIATNLFNPDYAWEVNKKLEAGIELGLFKDRIFASLSYYQNRCSNQLVGYPLPAISGFESIQYYNSPATVQNTGLEILLSSTILKNHHLNWTLSANVTIPKNKLLKYPGLESSSYSTTYIVGEPITIARVFNNKGVDPETGIYIYGDAKGQPVSVPNPATDQVSIVNATQKFYGGITNNVKFKGFELDLTLQFVKQVGQEYLATYMPGYYYSGGYNQPTWIMDRWQKPADNKPYQRFSQSDYSIGTGYQNASASNIGYGDASFIRLKNVSLSYSLPNKLVSKARIATARLYLQGQNLLTITGYQGLDPETQSVNVLPPLRTIIGGLSISF